MNKETVQEAAKRLCNFSLSERVGFYKCFDWQQERSYSEGEVLELLYQHTCELFKKEPMTLEDFFNKFKKK